MPTATKKKKPVVAATRSRASHPKAKAFDEAVVTAAIKSRAVAMGLGESYADNATKDWIKQQGLPTVAAILKMEGSDQSLVTPEAKSRFEEIAHYWGCEQFLDQLFGATAAG